MKKIVISGINMTQGGLLSIYQDCLKYLGSDLYKRYEIIALVHSKKLFENLNLENKITFLEFPSSKKSWLKRCWYEYYYFKRLSQKLKPYLWLSLHDMTANVIAEKRAVYCHNATPFFKMKFNEIKYDKKIYLFSKFYKYLYRINLKKNNYVIVQQNWIAEKFKNMFSIKNIVVASPVTNSTSLRNVNDIEKNSFFYPSIPRFYKNFEIICKVVEKLEKKGIKNFKVYLTLNENEGKYADEIFEKYKHLKNIYFLGMISREKVFEYYSKVEYLIFPSKLETWGLPLSEFCEFNKMILSIDLDYAHETLRKYQKVSFFKNEIELENLMLKLLNDEKIKLQEIRNENYLKNINLSSWKELFTLLLKE